MVTIQLKGRITESGELEIKLPEGLKPGNALVTIELTTEEELPWELRPWTDEELAELSKVEPKTGAEIVAAGHTGGWEAYGITDGAEYIEELRRKRREQRG